MLLLSACAASTPASTPTSSDSPRSPTGRFQTTSPLPTSSSPSGVPTTVPDARLAAIRGALTARGVTTDQLRVVSAESVTFNDGSLGCPTPGVQYTQAQVEGMRVVVEADARQFDFRFGRTDTPTLCENPGPRSTSSNR